MWDIIGVYQCYLFQSEYNVSILRPVQMCSNCLRRELTTQCYLSQSGHREAVLSGTYAILQYFVPNLNLRECEIQYYFYNPANHDESDKLEWPDLAQESSILDG